MVMASSMSMLPPEISHVAADRLVDARRGVKLAVQDNGQLLADVLVTSRRRIFPRPRESNSNSMTGSPSIGIAVGIGALDVFAGQAVGQFFLHQERNPC